MPSSPPTVCPCGGVRKDGVCSRCGPRKRQQDTRKGSTARGYDYQWQQFRLGYLAAHPLCDDCETRGIAAAATDIHHVRKLRDHPEAKYDEQWLKPLCAACHAKRTARGE